MYNNAFTVIFIRHIRRLQFESVFKRRVFELERKREFCITRKEHTLNKELNIDCKK